MQYVKISVDVSGLPDYEIDTLTYYLSEIGCDSFCQEDNLLLAFVRKTLFCDKSLNDVLKNRNYSVEDMPDKDWNEEWEKNYFQPIVIAERCVVYSSFHKNVPDVEYKIMIDPKMSFGTGHHQTTSGMLTWILDDDMSGKRILDMGCGTAVLGILAMKRGAQSALGIDIDEWCIGNAKENISLNGVAMDVELGSAASLKGREFDVVFANINLNILLADMGAYVETLTKGGTLYMSGFYIDDLPKIEQCATSLGLKIEGFKEKDRWVAVKFLKNF